MGQEYLQIINGKIMTPQRIIKNGSVIIKNGRIEEISNTNILIPDAMVIDAKENYIAPGFIDLHVHGGGGYNFNEVTSDAFDRIVQTHAQYGTTGLYATLEASPNQVFYNSFDICKEKQSAPIKGARILGLHLEGNYLNPAMKGGMNPLYLKKPNPDEYKDMIDQTDCIKRWSISPELPGALEMGEYLRHKGILPSLAHTVARYPLVLSAFQSGYTHVTHFYNAMTTVHKEREFKFEGTVESIYLMEDMTVELVADGIHVPAPVLQLVYRIKGIENTAIVTDAMAAAAFPKGTVFNNERVILEDGVCKLADRSAIAGSIATANRLIRTMTEKANIPLMDAIRMMTETPAHIMGISNYKGSLEKGKDADITIFDPEINVLNTIVEGQIVYG